MLPDGNRCFAGVAVSHDIGERFFCNADKAVFDFPRDCFSGVIAVYDRAESKIIDQWPDGFIQIDSFIPQVVHAGADIVHGCV